MNRKQKIEKFMQPVFLGGDTEWREYNLQLLNCDPGIKTVILRFMGGFSNARLDIEYKEGDELMQFGMTLDDEGKGTFDFPIATQVRIKQTPL